MDWIAPALILGVFGVLIGIPIYATRHRRGQSAETPPPSPPVIDRIGTGDGVTYERGWRVDEQVMPLDHGEFPPIRGG